MSINLKLFFASLPKAYQAFDPLADIMSRIVRTFVVLSLIAAPSVHAADHGDHLGKPINEGGDVTIPILDRDDINLTDLYVFTRGEGVDKKLVIIVNTNPSAPIPPSDSEEDYVFPSDLTLTINIDQDSEVVLDPDSELGGTITNSAEIEEDTTFTITFNGECSYMEQPAWNTLNNTICLNLVGSNSLLERVDEFQITSGLFDDPFIRDLRVGKNVGALVLEMPLVEELEKPLLIWATSTIPYGNGMLQVDHIGRALRSMKIAADDRLLINVLHPRLHEYLLHIPPDVTIVDPTLPVMFSNGRELTDDVVSTLNYPTPDGCDINDVPFLTEFPYLAPAHSDGDSTDVTSCQE